ncbi:MAG: glucose-6-phosphate isomerase [Gudongella sp.]|nr:glucose-6-phosphate isomerase [Gudongella sp.]
MPLGFDYSKSFLKDHEIQYMKPVLGKAHNMIHDGTGFGSEYSGWLDWTEKYDRVEYEKLKKVAENIRNNAQILLVIGIGGSYLGARAVIDALSNSFYNALPDNERKTPQIIFIGNNLSTKYYKDVLGLIKGKEVYINVISKSGTTTESAVAFRIFREYIELNYGKEEAKKRIIATTDKARGALRELVEKEGYESFIIPDEIGGRYSVLTAVGLLPIAVAGIDTDELILGANDAAIEYSNPVLEENDCYKYAITRQLLSRKDKDIEILVSYEPSLQYIGEWWKQLYGESEGKDGKGIFPASVSFTADLHSMGQWIQDGKRNIFETVINIEKAEGEIVLVKDSENLDGLNYLEGKTLEFINQKAMEGTLLAHIEGNVPNLVINVPELSAYNIGALIYFFEKACAISGYIQGVNPFDQPGVEAYKRNMFRLLGKEGY